MCVSHRSGTDRAGVVRDLTVEADHGDILIISDLTLRQIHWQSLTLNIFLLYHLLHHEHRL